MSRKSFGPIPEKEWAAAIDAPAGGAGKILRQFVPTFGIDNNDGELRKYVVTIEREVTMIEEATVRVEATSEENAKKIAEAMDIPASAWDMDGDPQDISWENIKSVRLET